VELKFEQNNYSIQRNLLETKLTHKMSKFPFSQEESKWKPKPIYGVGWQEGEITRHGQSTI
jgi:hypothetical protein